MDAYKLTLLPAERERLDCDDRCLLGRFPTLSLRRSSAAGRRAAARTAMSQIATGFTVSSASLDRLAALAQARDYASFWRLLKTEAIETEPSYSYSGSVVSVALDILTQRGWLPTLDDSYPAVATLATSGTSLVMCCRDQEAEEGLARLRSMAFTDAELAGYYRDYTGEEWSEAAQALREAIGYLERTLSLIPQSGDWALLFIG
jgi:hypothetical protein